MKNFIKTIIASMIIASGAANADLASDVNTWIMCTIDGVYGSTHIAGVADMNGYTQVRVHGYAAGGFVDVYTLHCEPSKGCYQVGSVTSNKY